MIRYKTEREIAIMREGGKRLRKVADRLVKLLAPGVRLVDIDKKAEELIKKAGGYPSFKTVKGYKWSTCISINEQIVHTPPSERAIKEGDIVSLDIGMLYKGYHTDYSETVYVGEEVDDGILRFLSVGKTALRQAIRRFKKGKRLGEVSKAIEDTVKKNGYFVIKELAGHGIGKELHEDPLVLNFLDKPVEKTLEIKEGLVVAIEVIYSMGTEHMRKEEGLEWSFVTVDKSLSAVFEHTVAITRKGTLVLTR